MTSDEPLVPISRNSAEHYRWGAGCDGWHLVKDASLSVIEEQVPPGAAEVRHHHERAQQFFYILEGAATMEVDGRLLRLAAGEGVRIPASIPHQFRNESVQTVRFLVISQPPSHGDRVDD